MLKSLCCKVKISVSNRCISIPHAPYGLFRTNRNKKHCIYVLVTCIRKTPLSFFTRWNQISVAKNVTALLGLGKDWQNVFIRITRLKTSSAFPTILNFEPSSAMVASRKWYFLPIRTILFIYNVASPKFTRARFIAKLVNFKNLPEK